MANLSLVYWLKDLSKKGNLLAPDEETDLFFEPRLPRDRVWKGIFAIRDLTKIRCGNRENDKYIDGIRDLTVPREAGLAKNWARDAGFMFACLSGMPETL